MVLLKEQVRQTSVSVDRMQQKIEESTRASYSARGAAVATSITVILALALEIVRILGK